MGLLMDEMALKNYFLNNKLEGSPILDQLVLDAATITAKEVNKEIEKDGRLYVSKLNNQVNFLIHNLGWSFDYVIAYLKDNNHII